MELVFRKGTMRLIYLMKKYLGPNRMNRNQVLKLAEEIFSVQGEYLWDGETHVVLRHPQSEKWFAIIMEVKKKSLHLEDETDEFEDIMNVKLNPIHIEDLLHEECFLPAWHMNKKYWISIRLSMISEEALKKLLEESWDLVKPKSRKK